MSNVTLSDTAYDKLKRLTQVGLPSLGSLYFGLSQIWGLPAGEQVVGSLALLTTFCGVILGVSTKNFNKVEASMDGQMLVSTDLEGKKTYSLELNGDPSDLADKDSISFKVVDPNKDFWDKSAE